MCFCVLNYINHRILLVLIIVKVIIGTVVLKVHLYYSLYYLLSLRHNQIILCRRNEVIK